MINSKTNKEPIRIWVPPCSTGQEAYSLAMLILEALGENVTNRQVQIFATDLSETAINKARLGVYSKDDMTGISPQAYATVLYKAGWSFSHHKKHSGHLCICPP